MEAFEVNSHMLRRPEPEFMDDKAEVEAYARADFADVNQAFVDRLLELVGSCQKATALDLGTGPGDIPVRAARARPRWRVVAMDCSYPMLRFARRTIENAGVSACIELALADAKLLPLRSHTFDVIFSNSILHHINDVDRFWAELKRVAVAGATVLLRDLARPSSPEAARKIVQQYAEKESALLRQEYYRSLLSAYTVEEVHNQLRRTGLKQLRVEMVTDRHLDIFGRL